MSHSSTDLHDMTMHFESVRNVKARYFRYLDGKAWDKLRDLFSGDAVFYGFPFETTGPGSFVSNVREYFTDVDSHHQGYMPLLSAVDRTTIRGIWSMHDYLIWPPDSRSYRGKFIPGLTGIRGYGVYEDQYTLVDGLWKISRMRLVRTRVELVVGELHLLSLEGEWARVDPDWIE